MTRNLNNTYLYGDSNLCGPRSASSTSTLCSAEHGGTFVQNSSQTWHHAADLPASGAAAEQDEQLAKNDWGNDQLNIDSHMLLRNSTLGDFPLSLIQADSLTTNVVGLGRNSTVLNALFASGRISTKTWGLLWGWQGASHGTDGSLVLGGYDGAKTRSPNITFPFDHDKTCPGQLVVTISDIVLNLKDGSSPSILPEPPGPTLRACIAPEAPMITLGNDSFASFLRWSETADGNLDRSESISPGGTNLQAQDLYALHPTPKHRCTQG